MLREHKKEIRIQHILVILEILEILRLLWNSLNTVFIFWFEELAVAQRL
jgi:hypothetical protein